MKSRKINTVKSRVLDFVEKKGGAKYTEIQEFIVDQKYGSGTYAAAAGTDTTWTSGLNGSKTKKCNPYRGYYSCALQKGSNRYPWSKRESGYFLVGKERLEKRKDGLYIVIREND
jgi:hypothetical protein